MYALLPRGHDYLQKDFNNAHCGNQHSPFTLFFICFNISITQCFTLNTLILKRPNNSFQG